MGKSMLSKSLLGIIRLKYNKLTAFILFLASIILFANNIYSQDYTTGLVGYWPFECSPNDLSGNSYDGQIFGSPLCVPGKFGKAYQFDGANDYILLPDDNSTEFIKSTGFTWSMWFKTYQPPVDAIKGIGQTLLSVSDNTLTEDIILGFGSNEAFKNTFNFSVDGYGGPNNRMRNPPSYQPGGGFDPAVWYHVTAVADYANNVIILYINGAEVDREPFTYTPLTENMPASIGASNDGTATSGYFNGAIDEVRIYSRALTAADVGALFNSDPIKLVSDRDSVKFGQLLCQADSVTTITLTNKGPGNISVTSTQFTVGTAFQVLNGGAFDIADKGTHDLQLVFTPTDVGDYYDTLVVENSNMLPPLMVYVSGRKDTVSYEIIGHTNYTLHFGQLCPNEISDKTISIKVNSSTDTKFLGQMSDPSNQFFIFLDSSIAESASPFGKSETRDVKIRFTGYTDDLTANNTLKITDPCGNIVEIFLVAEVNMPKFTADNIPDTTICPNNEIVLNLNIHNIGDKDNSFALAGTNPMFTFDDSVFIANHSDISVPVHFDGSEIGGRYSTIITITGRCGTSQTVNINVDIHDIQITLDPMTIDFGELVLCEPTSSFTRTFTLTNENIFGNPVKIIDVSCSNTFAFTTTAKIGDELPLNFAQPFDVVFMPMDTGSFSAELIIVLDTCDFTRKISLTGKATKIDITQSAAIDFGKVVDGDVIDTTVVFKNTGSASIQPIDFEPLAAPFSIKSTNPSPLPSILAPGDSIEVVIELNAIPGERTDILTLNATSACGILNWKIPLRSEGGFLAYVTLKVNDANMEGAPGDIIDVPIQLTDETNLDISNVSGFKADLSVNPTLFIPTGTTPEGMLTGDRLLVPVEFSATPGGDGLTLATFQFKVVLGNSEYDTIKIENVKPQGGFAQVDPLDGVFTLLGICRQGGVRLFEALETLYLSQSSPNPSSGEINIDFEVIEKGLTEIYIVNLDGEKVATIFDEITKPGQRYVSYNASKLPAGNYIYILKTPSQMVSRKLVIVK